MFKEIDLSRAIPRNTVSVTLRYEFTGESEGKSLLAQVSDNAQGENSIHLSEKKGAVTVSLRASQKLYFRLQNQALHLNLWIVDFRTLGKHAG